MSVYSQYRTRETPQRERAREDQVQNSAGGYAFQIDEWDRLMRFLILGSEGGTYYTKARELTVANAKHVQALLRADGLRVVQTALDVSKAGRAPKNDPALFVLAMATSPELADVATRQAAWKALPQIARTGTHLFTFLEIVKGFRGRGRGYQTALQRWYQDKDLERLAYQMVKYRQRGGWSHRDALRLAKPKPRTEGESALFRWATKGDVAESAPALVQAFEEAKTASPARLIQLIRDYSLTREMLPTESLSRIDVWEALLHNMPMTAMIRNLGNMSKVGLLAPMSEASRLVVSRLRDVEWLQKARIHPVSVLVALRTYGAGKGMRGSGTWTVVPQVVDALDGAFYDAFGMLEPSNKRTLLALDVSGSMGFDHARNPAMGNMTARELSAAMAMVTMRTEPTYYTMAFSSTFQHLDITARQRLDDVVRKVSNLNFGSTDCAVPMVWAMKHNVPVDTFVVYTDSETWYGSMHPFQALRKYREKMGIPARLAVVGMTATDFTIADPSDSGMMDVVGFDTAAPQLIADFSRGSL